MPRVVHFEIHADRPDRAIQFYTNVFNWQFTQWGEEDYWLINTGESGIGINGGLIKRKDGLGGISVNAYVCTIGVHSTDEYIKKVMAHGGLYVVPKTAIPGVGWLAYCKDTEGNIFGIMEDDQNAK